MQTSGGQFSTGWQHPGWNRTLATSFDGRAGEYARFRPEYPDDAVDAAVPPGARRVLDLAAGTGKLTGSLLGRGLDVIAVEPLPGMLAELRRRFPHAVAILGAAERIPLRNGVVDAVVVGQAFHWFDADRALAEMARVLRPGGTLAMVTNHDDEADPFVQDIQAALTRIGRPVGGTTGRGGTATDRGTPGGGTATDRGTPGGGLVADRGGRLAGGGSSVDTSAPIRGSGVPPFADHPSFSTPELTEFVGHRRQTVDDLIGLLHTYSYVIRASTNARAELDVEVRAIAGRYFPANPDVSIPMVCQVWRSRCRRE